MGLKLLKSVCRMKLSKSGETENGIETIEKWGNVKCIYGLKLSKSGETEIGVETIDK